MFSSTASIGEPEGSQDTPVKNTTPAKLRRPPRPPRQPATKSEVDECQILATGLMRRRYFENFYDAAFKVHVELYGEERSLREADKQNDELHELIQELEVKSKIAKQYNDELFKGFMAKGITSASPQPDVPYYKEHHDNLIIKRCAKSLTNQVDAVRIARNRFNLLTSTAVKLHAMTSRNEKLTEEMENTIAEKRQVVNEKIHDILELEQGLSDVQMKLVNKDLVIANLRNDYLTLSKAKIAACDNVNTLESGLRKSNSELEFMRIKLQHVVVGSKRLQAELQSTRIELASAGEQLKTMEERLKNESEQRVACDTLLASAKEELQTTKQRLENESKQREDRDTTLASTRKELETVKERLQNESSKAKDRDTALASARQELQTVNERLQDESTALTSAKEELQTVKERFQSESIALTSARQELQEVKECLKNMVPVVSKDDLRIFEGVQEGKAVVVRAQRLPKEPRALVIVQSEDRTRVIWHKNFSKYRIDMDEAEWYLRLRLEEASIEEPLNIWLQNRDIDPYDIEDWLNQQD